MIAQRLYSYGIGILAGFNLGYAFFSNDPNVWIVILLLTLTNILAWSHPWRAHA